MGKTYLTRRNKRRYYLLNWFLSGKLVRLETWKTLVKNWIRVKFCVQDLSDHFGAKKRERWCGIFSHCLLENEPIELDNQHRFVFFTLWGKTKTKPASGFRKENITPKKALTTKWNRQKQDLSIKTWTVQTVSTDGHPKSADDVRLSNFFFFNSTRNRKRWPDRSNTIS